MLVNDTVGSESRERGTAAKALPGALTRRSDANGAAGHGRLDEICEQPTTLERCLHARLERAEAEPSFEGVDRLARRAERLVLTGCGTSYHAALAGEYLIEQLARIPVEVEDAGEFRFRNAPMHHDTLVVAICESGESPDTLAAQRECRRMGLPVLAVCEGAAAAGEADAVVSFESGAAGGTAFTTQVTVLAMLAVHLGRMRHLSHHQGARLVHELKALPDVLRLALRCRSQVRRVANRFAGADRVLCLGRQNLYPVALQGALRLRELGSVHAAACGSAAEHGPAAQADGDTATVCLLPRGPAFDRAVADLAAVKARGGPVVAVACEKDVGALGAADEVVAVPEVPEYLQPLVSMVPLQLLACYIGLRGGRSRRPRHRADGAPVA